MTERSDDAMQTSSAESQDSAARLTPSIGVFALTCFGIGSTVGAGIFILTGTVAAQHAGPAVTLSFLIASFVCLLAGLCYAELAAMMPVAGSAYSYTRAALGDAMGWAVGWCLVLEYLFSGGLVAIGWSAYMQSTLRDIGLGLPARFSQAPFAVASDNHIVATGAFFDLPAVLLTLACAAMLLKGTDFSSRINTAIVIAKICAMLLFVFAGLAFVDQSMWHPYIPPNEGVFGRFGWSGVLQGASVLFFAYVGFDAVSTLAQDVRDPQRTVPRALFASIAVTTALYVAVAVVVTGLVSYRELDVPDPIYVALNAAGPSLAWLRLIIGSVAVVGLISVVLSTLLGQVRIFYAMGRDGLLPAKFVRINETTRVPHIATIVTGVTASIVAGLFPLSLLSELISMGTLFAFVMVAVSLMVLRHRRPDLARPFSVPLYPWIPTASVVGCLYLMWGLPVETWLRLALWLLIGAGVYGLSRRRRKSVA